MVAYLISPKFAHRFVGYLKEESVKTYTAILKNLDEGKLPKWEDRACPKSAIEYYELPIDAKFRDLILSVRADKAINCEINHYMADLVKDEDIEHLVVEYKQEGDKNRR